MIRFLKRVFDHYAAHGMNCSFVARSADTDVTSRKVVTLAFRRGRIAEGESVQMEILVEEFYPSGRSSNKSASASFDQATWDALVEHVKANRELDRAGKEVRS